MRIATAMLVSLLPGKLVRLEAADQPTNKPESNVVAHVNHLRSPIWNSSTCLARVLSVETPTTNRRPRAMPFPVAELTSVASASGQQQFERGKDFELAPDGKSLALLPGSRIPIRRRSELYPLKDQPNSIGSKPGDPTTSLLFGEGHYFHDQQIAETTAAAMKSGPDTLPSSTPRCCPKLPPGCNPKSRSCSV